MSVLLSLVLITSLTYILLITLVSCSYSILIDDFINDLEKLIKVNMK